MVVLRKIFQILHHFKLTFAFLQDYVLLRMLVLSNY